MTELQQLFQQASCLHNGVNGLNGFKIRKMHLTIESIRLLIDREDRCCIVVHPATNGTCTSIGEKNLILLTLHLCYSCLIERTISASG